MIKFYDNNKIVKTYLINLNNLDSVWKLSHIVYFWLQYWVKSL